MSEEELPLFVHWMEFLDWLLSRTEKFPRSVRLSISNRIEALALDILEEIIEARYRRDRLPVLRAINLRLEKLRVLLRICHGRGYLHHDGYEYGVRQLATAGRMIGGWIRSLEAGADRSDKAPANAGQDRPDSHGICRSAGKSR
ncbi:MAG: diversity-generating retroelement protein Avd [Candidatus Eisenbacteria sp.]|nr:diversity-generating retroelement protein Avd [Candidatus Eisenbacteria bacterium]